MNRRHVIALILPLVALGLLVFSGGEAPAPDAPIAHPEATTRVTAPAALDPLPRLDADAAERSIRARYALTLNISSTIGDGEGPGMQVTGTWTTERLSDDRVAARLSDATIDGHHLAPTADEAERDLELLVVDGVVEGLAFAPRTSARARRLLSTLATLTWPTVRDQDDWLVEMEDITGSHAAQYTRIDDQTVERRIAEVIALRSPAGLRPVAEGEVGAEGVSTFRFDAHGLREARLEESRTLRFTEKMTVTARTHATLRRLDAQVVTRRAPVPYPLASFNAEIEVGQQQAMADDQLVGDADLATLMGALDSALRMDDDHPDSQKWRSRALERLTALVRLDPTQAQAIAADIVRLDSDDPRVPFLAGALGSANTADATNALAGVLDGELAPAVRHNVHANLALTEAPTDASLAALAAELEGELDASAARALGSQSRRMGEEAEPVKSVIEQLIERYRAATTPAERAAALQALGNSGNPAVLPVLMEAANDSHPSVASNALRAMRFIPGEAVDEHLAVRLEAGVHARAVVEAVSYRDGALWGPRLAAVRDRFSADKPLVDVIDRLLQRWG